jgi:hypothetical protein
MRRQFDLRGDIASDASSPRNRPDAASAENLTQPLKPGAGLVIVKGCVAARWPSATLDRRSAGLQVGTRRCRPSSDKEMQ